MVVSNEYLQAVNADSRQWNCRIELYLYGNEEEPIVLTADNIHHLTLLEEAMATSSIPLGIISSNEFTVNIINEEGRFSPSNINGPYYGLLNQNVKIIPYLSLKTTAGYEEVPLGVFYSTDWQEDKNYLSVKLTGVDRIYALMNQEIPKLKAIKNTNIYQMFVIFFETLGLSNAEYYIDPSITRDIKIGWFHGKLVKNILSQFALAANASIFTDRNGIIIVKNNFGLDTPIRNWTDDNQIIKSSNPIKVLEIYQGVRLGYSIPSIETNTSILEISDLIIPHGGLELSSLEFSKPVANVAYVKLSGAKSSNIKGFRYGSNNIDISISNTGKEEIVGLNVYGREISSNTAFINHGKVLKDNRYLQLENIFIQDKREANLYASWLFQYISQQNALYELETKGDPAVTVMDMLTIEDKSNYIFPTIVKPQSIQLRYDGALRCKISARKPIIPFTWAMVSPGIFVYVPVNLKEVES